MKKYGCIGKKLGHSFSKDIHAKLADYKYELIELNEEEIDSFFKQKDFTAINVTIPYKQTVIPYLDSISEIANRIGAVNTIVNKDGKLLGYNTDYYGMKALIEKTVIDFQNKKILILGTGGTSKTAQIVAQDLGANQILTVSRRESLEFITYDQAKKNHSDANIIINTTPSGMFPDCESKPIDISYFPQLEGVIDAIYNPLCSNLILDAKEKGLKAEGGLYMLVMQAVVAVEKFLDTKIQKEIVDQVFTSVLSAKQNIVLTGMPGSGKSTIGKLLKIPNFTFVDTDEEIEKQCGCSIKELIQTKGEQYFRDLESNVIKEIASKNCQIISTGGGAILREENVTNLKKNGKIFYISANLSRLCATQDRPLSDTKEKLAKLYEERIQTYLSTADVIVPDMKTPQEEADFILTKRMECL
ncbi:MAG: hypothetical protein IJ293_01385 [Treponema sp.]|nr:hypothetical protein [Treponema sp.]